jgi:hypothetical protein
VQEPGIDIMRKKNSPNNLAEKRSESSNILDKFFKENYEASEEELMPLIEKKAVERELNVEPIYFFKGAVLCLFFCIPFWIFLFWLIS